MCLTSPKLGKALFDQIPIDVPCCSFTPANISLGASASLASRYDSLSHTRLAHRLKLTSGIEVSCPHCQPMTLSSCTALPRKTSPESLYAARKCCPRTACTSTQDSTLISTQVQCRPTSICYDTPPSANAVFLQQLSLWRSRFWFSIANHFQAARSYHKLIHINCLELSHL